MNRTTKLVSGIAAVLVTMAAAGTVAFADTTPTNDPSTTVTVTNSAQVTTALRAQLKAERATVKQLQSQSSQLSKQIKADMQKWKSANPNPFSQLTASEQSTVKGLRSDEKGIKEQVKPLRSQAQSLRAQLKAAKQSHDVTTVTNLKSQLHALTSQISADIQKVKADQEQIAAILPTASVKSYHQKQLALKDALGNDHKTGKPLEQQLKSDLSSLKADRQNKAWTNVATDLQKLMNDLNQVISVKQQLLQHFPS